MYSKKRVAAYARVSTDFTDQLHSLSAQREYFEDYINSQSDWTLVEIYYDEGITGTSTKHREGFNRMIKDCEDGKIDTILTKEVSRFARNTVDTLNFTRKLKALKINVIFTNDGIDTNDKDGELRLTIMASLAQEESRKTSERVKWGMKRRMEKGEPIGRTRYFGYKVIENQFVVVPEEAEIVRRIYHEYYYDKKGSTMIARDLNADNIPSATGKLWTGATVLEILKNEKYCGDYKQWKYVTEDYLTKHKVRNNGSYPDAPSITIKDHHLAIVTHEVWDGVQAEIARRGKSISEGRRHSNKYWFSAKISCGKCGKPFTLTGATSIAERQSMRCRNRAEFGANVTVNSAGKKIGCDNRTVLVDALALCVRHVLKCVQVSKAEIEEQLWSEIRLSQSDLPTEDIEALRKEVETIKLKKKTAIDLLLEGLISKDDLAEQNKYYDEKLTELNERITNGTDIENINKKQIDGIKKYIETVRTTDSLDIDNVELYRDIVDRIVIQNHRLVDIYLSFVPFGYRVAYTLIKANKYQRFAVIVDSCEIIA